MRILAIVALVLALAGCSQAGLLEKFSSPEDQAVAKHYVELLRAQAFEEIENAADPRIKSPTFRDTLGAMAAMIPAGAPTSVKLVGAQNFHESDGVTVNTTLEYEFPGRWLLINVAIRSQGGTSALVGFNVAPQKASLEALSRFDLEGKSPGQYAMLVFAPATVALSLYVLVLCIRTKLAGRKWPWVLFIIAGVGNLSVNWSTAQWAFAPISVQLFSASAIAPLYGPWTIAVSLPLGAIVFLFRRRRLMVQPAEQ